MNADLAPDGRHELFHFIAQSAGKFYVKTTARPAILMSSKSRIINGLFEVAYRRSQDDINQPSLDRASPQPVTIRRTRSRAQFDCANDLNSMTPKSHLFAGVRALIFDLDGTLIDSGLDLALAVSATIQKMGRAPLDHQQIFACVGHGAQHLITQVLGPSATEAECRTGLAYFLTYYREHMLDNTVTYPGVREGLAALEGLPMAVLTNKPVRFSQQLLEGLGLARYFRYIYGGNSFRTKKPDPAGMQTLLRDFAVAPEQAMLVGDSDVDVQTARNSGSWACGVSYGLGTAGFAQYPPDLMVDTLTELAEYLDYQPSVPQRVE